MSQETQTENPTQIQQQIAMLNLRINDMMTQLNATMKTMMEENHTLKKENTELKQKKTD